ncbi:MAG: hypothetical protein H7039_07955 [Bryobacteraceae bacterium]|nr:hypothetical protein [Bryobacteraceae bacterium]
MKLVTVLIALVLPAWSQYSEMAATDDGAQLYFTTPLVTREATITQFPESRIFRYVGNSVELFAERGNLAPTNFAGSSDGARSLSVSGDGQSVTFTLTNICVSGDSCTSSVERAEIRGRNSQVVGNGSAVMSRNGQWAVLTSSFRPQVQQEYSLINLATGARTNIDPPATLNGQFSLASDGTVLSRRSTGPATGFQLGLRRGDEFTPLRITGTFALLGMSDDASTVYLNRQEVVGSASLGTVLVAYDVQSGTEKRIHASSAQAQYVLLGLSNNGHRVLFRVITRFFNGPAFVGDVDLVKTAQLNLGTDEASSSSTISGYGNYVFVGTTTGRLLRFPLDSQANATSPEELVPSTVYIQFPLRLSPGSLIKFSTPLRDQNLQDRILVSGRPLYVVAREGNQITAQVPWEITPGLAEVRLDFTSDSPFSQQANAIVAPEAPEFLSTRRVLQDFSGYVTALPQPGDVFHMYFTGLGPVDGPVQTGVPAPIGELRYITGNLRCRFHNGASDAETVFAGLAPGYIGVYQVTFRLPANTPSQPVSSIQCGLNTSSFAVFGGPSLP